MKYNISFDIAAIVLSVGLLIIYYSKRSIMTKQRRVFEALLWISLISDVLDIAGDVIGIGASAVTIAVGIKKLMNK